MLCCKNRRSIRLLTARPSTCVLYSIDVYELEVISYLPHLVSNADVIGESKADRGANAVAKVIE